MATTSDVTMLREISAAGDRGRTGALDVEWEGAHVTLFFMFGHPTHVVFDGADGRRLVGEPALNALVAELPNEFRVAPWRRAMVTDDTLHFTAEDLMGLFQRRNAPAESNGHAADPPAPTPAGEPAAEPAAEPTPAGTATAGPAPAFAPAPPAGTEQPPFGLYDFPLLPLATTLWTDAAANVIDLEPAVPRLPDSLIVLSGPTCQGVALVVGGRVSDAVWVNAAGGRLGDEAAHAVMNSLEGTLTAYRSEDQRLMSALPMLWRAPRLAAGLPGAWLHTEDVVAEVRTSGRSCCLVVESADPGVALFSSGELVAVYTAGQRWAATSMAALRGLLHEDGARVTVLGDPTAATVAPTDDAPAPAVTSDPTTDEQPAATAPESEPVAPDAVETQVTDAAAGDDGQADAVTGDGDAGSQEPATAAPQPRNRGRRGKDRQESDVAEAVATPAEEPAAGGDELAAAETEEHAVDAPTAEAGEVADTTAPAETAAQPAGESSTDVAPAPSESDGAEETTDATPAHAGANAAPFEPAVFTIADIPTASATNGADESAPDPSGMAGVEARAATEFVPARLDIDVDALRSELTTIATVWLGEDDAAPVAEAIGAARPGVDDFVSTIRAIGAMEIPGHESAVVRAMAREMHFRASEVLCGV